MSSIILDMILPGSGRLVDVLSLISDLCSEMQEGQGSCKRLQGQLQDIFDALHKMDMNGQVPPSDAVEKYIDVVSTYLQYLQTFNEQSLVKRLINHHAMMDELKPIYEGIDMLFRLLNLAGTAAMMDWKQQWETDQKVHQQVLADLVGTSKCVLSELQDTRSQIEAVLTLKFELEKRCERQNEDMMQLMRSMVATVSTASAASVETLPTWFIPPSEVVYKPEAFARGSFGSVHLGVWGPGTKVVVKCFLVEEMDERERQKIEREMNIWYQFNHPSIVKMLGASHVSEPPFIVCEHAVNGDLCSFLARSAANKRQMWQLLYEAALGLDYIHKKKVVHGDLKLNNILVAAGPQAKLSDFGLSAVRTSSTASKPSGADTEASGGLRWRAPECLESRPTFASDIYSFAMCMIEAVLDEPPSAYLDDNAVRANLRQGVIPLRPDGMSDDVWELVVAMTHADPSKRAGLAQVLSKLEAVAAEEAARNERSPELSQNAAAVTPATPLALDPTNPSVILMNEIAGETDAAKREQKLFLLAQKCVDDDHRRLVYAANGLEVLTGLIRNGQTYFTQAYALECLRWAMAPDGQVTKTEMNALQKCVRAIAPEELASVVQALQNGTGQAVDDAAVRCACIAAQGGVKELQAADVVPLLVTLVTSGNDTQKLWAVEALRYLSLDDTAVRDDLVKRDLMEPLATLLLVGTEAQKHRAALTVGRLAYNPGGNVAAVKKVAIRPIMTLLRDSSSKVGKYAAVVAMPGLASSNGDSCIAIAREGAIPLLVALVRAGTELEKEYAAHAVAELAFDNTENGEEVAREGGIGPLMELLRTGTSDQKWWAAYAVRSLVNGNESNCAEVMCEGGVALLVELVRTGTEQQAFHASYALGYIADGNDDAIAAIKREGAVVPLEDLARRGTERQMSAARYALSELGVAIQKPSKGCCMVM